MTEATAWAVMASGSKIYVNSVAETRRAAIINWLVTEKRVWVMAHHSDADIESMWGHHGQYVDCRNVTITARSDRATATSQEK